MPKVKWIRPKVNHLEALLKTYKKERRMTCAQIGKLVGCSPQNVQKNLSKPADRWTIGQIKLYCDALGIDYRDAVISAVEK